MFLGVSGVIAAGILLAVSAAMNYRFGFSLGKTAMDGQIYGLASAAADCFKALVPFFFFAAIRNRMWSQAAAAALVWTVVTAYSMTSALGHAALNRLDTTGQRAVEAATYKDLRAEAKRAQDQLAWIPPHRPGETVQADISGPQGPASLDVDQRCTEVTGKTTRDFCQQFHKLSAELASAQQAAEAGERIAEIERQARQGATGGTVMAEADPQASVLAKLTGLEIALGADGADDVRGAADRDRLGFGMYVAFAYWRLRDQVKKPAEATDAHIWQRSEESLPTVRAPQQAAHPAQIEAPKVCGQRNGTSDSKGQRQQDGQRAARARQRRAALLQREDRCRGRELQPHVNRALRGILRLVRGERQGGLRPSARDARDRRTRRQEGQDRQAHPVLRHRAEVRRRRGGQQAA